MSSREVPLRGVSLQRQYFPNQQSESVLSSNRSLLVIKPLKIRQMNTKLMRHMILPERVVVEIPIY